MKSLHRAVDLLINFQSHALLSVEQMAGMTKRPKSSVYRFVRILRERGLLSLDPQSKKYRLGPLIYQLGRTGGPDLSQLAQPALERLAKESGESSFLSVRGGWETRYAACVEGPERIRFTAPLGKAMPLYAGASAKVILAFMEEEERGMYLRSVRLKRFCRATIQDKRKLEQSLLLIRRRGYAFTQEELYRGAWGLAAPILDEDGVAIASLAITGVQFRSPQKRLPQFISMIREAAQEVSEKLTKTNALETLKSQRTGS
jgi:DNA-binding IclR family transcriptional regulator